MLFLPADACKHDVAYSGFECRGPAFFCGKQALFDEDHRDLVGGSPATPEIEHTTDGKQHVSAETAHAIGESANATYEMEHEFPPNDVHVEVLEACALGESRESDD